jgi:hypothetical protein
MIRKKKTAGVLLTTFWGMIAVQAAIFSQDFSSSTTVEDYIEATTPSQNQLTLVNGVTASIDAGRLKVVNAAGTSGNVRRWVDMEGTPVEAMSFSYEMEITVAAGYAANTRLITGVIGQPVGGQNWMAWGIDATGVENEWNVTGTPSVKFTGPQTVTFFLNDSSASLKYLDPAAGVQELAANTYDVWVGTALLAEGRADAYVHPEYDLTSFSLGLQVTPAATCHFDHFEVLELPPDPIASRTLYQDDFSGAVGVASTTVPEVFSMGFDHNCFHTGLDGNGLLESTDPAEGTAGYRVKLGTAPLTDDSDLSEISYTVTMRTPTNDWLMIGFQEEDENGLLVAANNVGPLVQFNPTSVVLRGGTWDGGNTTGALMGFYSPGDVITAEMTYHVADQTMDLVVNGTTVTNGFSLEHEFPVGTPSDPVVYWLNTQLRYQPSAADGGATIDHLQVMAVPAGYAGWAGEWGIEIGSETNDYDGDGLSNFAEYGQGGDPTDQLDQGTLPVFDVDSSRNLFSCIHPQLSDPDSGLSYFVELNRDLVDGIWTPFGCAVTGTNRTGGALDFVTNVTDMAEDEKFMRLNIVEAGSADELRALILKGRPLPLTDLDVVEVVDVADFGAVADDGLDDRAAVAAAVAHAKSLVGPVQVDFSSGVYDFFAVTDDFSMSIANAAIPLSNCRDLILDGQGAEIVIHRQDVSFTWVWASTNLIVRNFSIDYDPLPFSQGTVAEILSDGTGFLLELDSGFPDPTDPFFASCESWGMLKDATQPGRLKENVPSFFSYDSITSESSNLFRVVLADAAQSSYFETGDPFVINGRSASIGRYGTSENITFDGLTATACPSALFVGTQTSRLNVLNCKGQLKGDRLIVSGSDGVHCQSARIGPWVENCDFEGLSDDCLNIYGLPIYVLEQVSPTQMTVYARASVLPGDRLAFFDPNAGAILQETTVVSFSGNTLVLADPVGEMNIAPAGTPMDVRAWKIYDHAYNLDTIGNHYVYRNNHMHDGRRYGMLIKASYGLIENNVFEGLSRNGMVFENNIGWPEGFWSQNILIQSNRVSECGYGNADPCVSIASKKLNGTAEVVMTLPIQKNIFILNNVFNAVTGPALELSGVSNLTAEGNTFTSGSESGALITVQYSEDIVLTNNVDEGRIEFN